MFTPSIRLGQVLLGLGLFCFCGCNLDYYLHLAGGQTRVLINRTPIKKLLAQSTIADKHRNQFELIHAILNFAETLGLETGDSYTTFYDTGGNPISWNVSASPPDHFEPFLWEFLIVGSVPYKGFFNLNRAENQRDALISKGYDAIISRVTAYSTLGFFSDPILSGMLDYSPDQLADLILHELTHATAYSSGFTDYNESLATFVGRQGSLLFLSQHYGADTPHLIYAKESRADNALFRKFMAQTVASLDSLYSLGLSHNLVLDQRISVFNQRKLDYQEIKGQFTRLNFDSFLRWEINNARLLSYRRYNSNQDLFLTVLSLSGDDLANSLIVFTECAETDNPWGCLDKAIETRAGASSDLD